ncbi:hypothetical protein BDV96DRAFT_691715 [Lophiotrema nucula]|uniref:Uncharacterized protein n=1 Tax=Lophiotrema nucula TaxID=690887 RepID=A0A6A5YRF4_9PLEO|nr:hypothetical protein BDV96DRAFT_691715 [Lophiotrema nucula]
MSDTNTDTQFFEIDGVMWEINNTDTPFDPFADFSWDDDSDNYLATTLTNFLTEPTQAYPSPSASIAHSSPESFATAPDYYSLPMFTNTPIPVPAVTIPAPANPAPPLTNTTSIYGQYAGLFSTGAEAKSHRKSARGAPKPADDVAWVKQNQREHWVMNIYNALVDTSAAIDGPKCPYLLRFKDKPVFSQQDLEAAAHNIFDKAIAVHERGWCRPAVYRKEAKRGDLVDRAEKSVSTRLDSICALLRKSKAACNDAMQSGLPLAKLVDNPYAHGAGKTTNAAGNSRRGEMLKVGKERVVGGRVEKKGAGKKKNRLILTESD